MQIIIYWRKSCLLVSMGDLRKNHKIASVGRLLLFPFGGGGGRLFRLHSTIRESDFFLTTLCKC